jgi:hypothetical protein
MEMLIENWVSVHGYEGRYEISDQGRVKSVQRFRRGKSGCMVPIPEKIMRPATKKRSANGRTLPYMEIKFRDGGTRTEPSRSFLVHRLVAQAFVGELYEGAQVDHIDGDHQNNHRNNLRILSTKEHGRLHPCFVDKARNASMQAAAKAKLSAMRISGELVGRHRV